MLMDQDVACKSLLLSVIAQAVVDDDAVFLALSGAEGYLAALGLKEPERFEFAQRFLRGQIDARKFTLPVLHRSRRDPKLVVAEPWQAWPEVY